MFVPLRKEGCITSRKLRRICINNHILEVTKATFTFCHSFVYACGFLEIVHTCFVVSLKCLFFI